MILQLSPQIPVKTKKGDGQALFLIDYSEEHDLKWIVALDDSGEVWVIPNKDIRLFENYSMGRKNGKHNRR